MKDLVGWQSKGKERARSRKLPVFRQLAASMGGLVRHAVSTTLSGLASFLHRLQDTAQETKAAAVKIHSVHVVKRLFL